MEKEEKETKEGECDPMYYTGKGSQSRETSIYDSLPIKNKQTAF